MGATGTIVTKLDQGEIKMKDMERGSLAILCKGPHTIHHGEIIYRFKDSFISLSNLRDGRNWDLLAADILMVRKVPVGTVIELVVNDINELEEE